MKTLTSTWLICLYIMQAKAFSRDELGQEYFNLWLSEIHGGEDVAKRVARDQGFTYRGPAEPFENYYEFTRDELPEVSSQNCEHLSKRLMEVEEVKWAEQQKVLKRALKGSIREKKAEEDRIQSDSEQVPDEIQEDSKRESTKKVGRFDTISSKYKFSTKPAEQNTLNMYSGPTKQGYKALFRSRYGQIFNDPLWKNQWYLQDYRTWNSAVLDHNVVPVWEMGYTGEGMTVMVVDGPIETDHPDLKDNYNEDLSYNLCSSPWWFNRFSQFTSSKKDHGTKCAGVIAMVADNNKCGVGIAYNAKVAGAMRECIFDRATSDAKGQILNLEHVDVYSNSWGPPDDGKFWEKVSRIMNFSLNFGIRKGRKGKGAIYVFAAGNGRHDGDNCAADGTVNHVGVIAITSASDSGSPTWYGERCTAVFAATYSGNDWGPEVTSIDEDGRCTNSFMGTSSSTPLAAGIFALVLQSKPELTYRDLMHLIAMTAEVAPLANNPGIWYRNARGIWVSNDFGFGLLNAENMVLTAKNWKNVPNKKTCEITITPGPLLTFETDETKHFFINTLRCKESPTENVQYLEHLELVSTIHYPFRGALEIYITSPAGTRTLLLQPRLNDFFPFGLNEQTIKSVHNWGEDPRGTWKVSVQPISLLGYETYKAMAEEFVLILHGTSAKPDHYNQPRKYAAFRLPDGTTPWTK